MIRCSLSLSFSDCAIAVQIKSWSRKLLEMSTSNNTISTNFHPNLTELAELFHQEKFSVLESWQRQLLEDSLKAARVWQDNPVLLTDYAQIVFPASKAYEGFLKMYLFKLGLISKETYRSKRFRIGRSLNPDVYPNQRDEWWLYDDVEQQCGKAVARQLWNAWLDCRNRLFHYFPAHPVQLSYLEALESLRTIGITMSEAVECKWEQLQPELESK